MTKNEIIAYVRGRAGTDAPLILGFIQTESSFRPGAFANDKNGGSYGLMQLNLVTAEDRGFKGTAPDLYDEVTNIGLGMAQVQWIRDTLAKHEIFELESVIAAYNEGVGAVLEGRPDPTYVNRVLTAMKDFA